MSIADDQTNPKPVNPLAKSLDTIAALRAAMEKRLAEKQRERATASPKPEPETRQKFSSKPPEMEKNQDDKSSEFARKIADPAEWARIMFRIAEHSQKLIQNYLERNKGQMLEIPAFDPAHLSEAFFELTNHILKDPEHFVDAQISLWQGYIKIWQTALERAQGKKPAPIVVPEAADKRFKDDAWQDVWLFDFIKQSYLFTAHWVYGLVEQETKGLEPRLAHKLEFYTRQLVDAIAPSNFWLTNPEVLRATFETGGENLIKGLENLLDDLERGHGQLHIRMSDMQAFKVGESLAVTQGKVIFQNDLMQLIQYAPETPTVFRVPLLIIPPWINKYYILDLREKNSFIRYLVTQGHTVFCISWANPDERHAKTNFDDYMVDGAFAAMRTIKRITGEEKLDILGYCIGGTLLAAALAYLKVAPQGPEGLPEVASATYLVTLTDFSDPGDIGVFIDEDQVKIIEAHMAQRGYLDAAVMATTFNLLRANDLIWSFVINNYLLGKEPFPFDILYWNSDSTNLPEAMHSFYLRKMYIENALIKPNGLLMKDVPIDLRVIDTPSFLLSTREDHIAPWRSTYVATQLYKGPVKFMLAGSGHIAGIVNPPTANKYGYWMNDSCPPEPDEWFKTAQQHQGSWWPAWLEWLKQYAGEQVPARDVEDGIENAPGSYVRVRAV